MASTFFRSVRSLDADNSQRSYLGLALASLLLAAWMIWFFLARVSIYAVTNKADLEVIVVSVSLRKARLSHVAAAAGLPANAVKISATPIFRRDRLARPFFIASL